VHEVERGGGVGGSFWSYYEVEHIFEVSMSVLCTLGLRKTKPLNIERLQTDKCGLRLKLVNTRTIRTLLIKPRDHIFWDVTLGLSVIGSQKELIDFTSKCQADQQ
jgi:hypothetical protein